MRPRFVFSISLLYCFVGQMVLAVYLDLYWLAILSPQWSFLHDGLLPPSNCMFTGCCVLALEVVYQTCVYKTVGNESYNSRGSSTLETSWSTECVPSLLFLFASLHLYRMLSSTASKFLWNNERRCWLLSVCYMMHADFDFLSSVCQIR